MTQKHLCDELTHEAAAIAVREPDVRIVH
jgi:hypothetical protein